MMLSDLPRDLAEEVLVRLSVTSMRAVRFVCKKWNTLTKVESFTKKHLARAKAAASREVVVVMNDRVNLMSVNLHGIHNNVDPSINHLSKLDSLTDLDEVDMFEVFQCDGLLLCITRDRTRFVVWNPYCGQTRYFKHNRKHVMNKYAIGYETRESSGRSYKVLIFDEYTPEYVCYELDYINSETRMEIIPTPITKDWYIPYHQRSVSLKGNTYWYSEPKFINEGGGVFFLICFDFTRERFGPHLSLPFRSYTGETISLSSVRDEQLAVLFQHEGTLYTEIWITTEIEPETVSWSKLFFAVDGLHIPGRRFGSFFVDEEKKVVVVFDEEYREMRERYIAAYIIGEDGIITKIDLGKETRGNKVDGRSLRGKRKRPEPRTPNLKKLFKDEGAKAREREKDRTMEKMMMKMKGRSQSVKFVEEEVHDQGEIVKNNISEANQSSFKVTQCVEDIEELCKNDRFAVCNDFVMNKKDHFWNKSTE
ncbi:PREDICTED: putative F-box protein At3g17620 [Camelina sativa]|uniref:F-box protein At3g17620 n=1 Tax=Camelina sativa TaxID=90675 RepID=A0ABM0XRL8_CAMSA|nr:PREDICTED: putative F-box protein At3g17620 [Camelina sativa]